MNIWNRGKYMNMVEELKAWADKWNIPYDRAEDDICIRIWFDSVTSSDPIFSYHKPTGSYAWYGGD
jgi:hypothetical protein